MSMILSLYRGLTTLSAPLITHYLKKRLRRGKEHPTRFPERLGQASNPRPDGALVWLHGASVGEAISLLPLITQIKADYPKISILVTTGSVTSAALMADRLPDGVIHQFIPVDRLSYVHLFLDHWKPNLALWCESELWPNLVYETHKRAIPMALINARMSEKSLKSWSRVSGFISTLLGAFDLILAQTEKDGLHYQKLGGPNVQCLGNLKYASPALPCDPLVLENLKTVVGDRPLWLAASTHPGEELYFARIHQKLKDTFPNLLSIIAPRHPDRGTDIKAELSHLGLNVAQRSVGETLKPDTDIYLCDTLGEMGLLYRLSPITFMGKSMEPLGGQNPLEPARLHSAIICGPYMTNFAEIMTHFTQNDAIKIAANEQEVLILLSALLTNPIDRNRLADEAFKVAQAEVSVLDRTMKALSPLFQKCESSNK
jgi:3-deoxy-D-manno-octulosonic-acid transferase